MTKSIYSKLLTYSYNIVGSSEDAHDVVQDAMEKYIALDKSEIENEVNYLIKMVINLSINFKNRSKKFSKYGIWLPEPMTTGSADAPLIKEQVANYSLMVLFEELNPKERAVFILREGFDYGHGDIAHVLNVSEDNSRQLYVRARKKLKNQSFKKELPPKDSLNPYVEALMAADTDTLESLFAEDICLMADGGNSVKVVTKITEGKQRTAELLQYVYGMFLDGKEFTFTYINHQPALLFKTNNRIMSCMVFNFNAHNKLSAIYSIVDPEKLRNLHQPKGVAPNQHITKLLAYLDRHIN